MLSRSICVLTLLGLALTALAGGSGLNVVVVVNQNSTNSIQLGNEYCEKRGVPPQNLFRMTTWTGGAITWLQSEFEANLRDPLLAMVNASGLTNQIQYVLLSMDIPYRVMSGDSADSTTSALFYGFKTNDPPPNPQVPDTCSLPDVSSNSFAFSELPFVQARPNTADTNSFLTFMLTAENLGAAEAILNRGLAADSSFPTQTVYLEKTSDQARNVRFFNFDNAIFENRVYGNSSVVRISSDSTSFNALRGLLTGFATFNLATNTFVPGGLGDSLTSFGGYLFESSGQTNLFMFLDAGAAASYGTVVEPCNYLQKFPDPMVYFYQARGFSAAEAYYLSLANPYQGLFVGEPLSAPFAAPGQADWALTNHSVLIGTVSLPSAVFSSSAPNLPMDQVDLFVDGVFLETLTNIPPTAGNLLSLNINGMDVPYIVPPGGTVASIASNLADVVNLQSNALKVAAFVAGDRVEFQGLDVSIPGSNLTLSATESPGVAPTLTTMATAAQPTFPDTLATGLILLTVTNNTAQGDWMQLQFTLTNGTQISVAVTNATPDTNVFQLAQSLVDAVNATPGLQGPEGVLGGEVYPDTQLAQFLMYARSPGWRAAQIQATLTTSPDLVVLPPGTRPLQDNLLDLRPRNHLYISDGMTGFPLSFTLDTTRLTDGFHDLTLVAYEGTSVRTQTRISRTIQIHNTNLSANLVPQVSSTNAFMGAPLLVSVSATPNSIARIELFSTGGSLGVVSNQSSAMFSVSTDLLGAGLHPFYAIVTDVSGNQFRTEAAFVRILPPLVLSITNQPLLLSWKASPGLVYDILSTTSLSTGFQKVATVTATGSVAQWVIPVGNNAAFYRLRLSGG